MSFLTIANTNNPVGQGIFVESDFFYKGKQSPPSSHEISQPTIKGWELLYEIFSLKYGQNAKPYFTSTLRLPGDNHYYVENNPSKGKSYHSRAQAIDGNWSDSTVEKEIILILAYSLKVGSPIAKKLRDNGINGFGTYYLSAYGTFIHLDDRPGFAWWKRPSRSVLNGKAKRLHDEFMELEAVKQYFGLVPVPTPTPTPTPPVPDNYTTPEIEVTTSIKEKFTDWREEFANLLTAQRGGGEDKINREMVALSWFFFILTIFSISLVVIYFAKKSKVLKSIQ